MFTENANRIFNRSIEEYHRWDDVDHPIDNPYAPGTIDHLLYHKNWIDTVQWHLEDIIRDPAIDPAEALLIKRRIDKSNQDRTDMVEYVDSYLLDKYKDVTPAEGARLNTETPAWAIDRLSILALKIYHMAREAERTDVDDAHRAACRKKLDVFARAAGRPFAGHRRADRGHRGGPQVHEDLQTDENVQRPGTESGALWAEKIAWGRRTASRTGNERAVRRPGAARRFRVTCW